MLSSVLFLLLLFTFSLTDDIQQKALDRIAQAVTGGEQNKKIFKRIFAFSSFDAKDDEDEHFVVSLLRCLLYSHKTARSVGCHCLRNQFDMHSTASEWMWNKMFWHWMQGVFWCRYRQCGKCCFAVCFTARNVFEFYLDIRSNEMKFLPTEIGYLTALTSLCSKRHLYCFIQKVPYNQFEVVPTEIGLLTSLIYLKLK